MCHDQAWNGLLACSDYRDKDAVRSQNGSLVYVDPREEPPVTKSTRSTTWRLRGSPFADGSWRPSDVATDKKEQRYQASVIPASSRAMRKLKIPGYLRRDENNTKTRRWGSREATTESRSAAAKCGVDCRQQQALQVIAFRKFRAG